RVWRPAIDWLERNREFLRLRANVTQYFERWVASNQDDLSGRDASLLLPPGLPIEEATRLLTIHAGRLDSPILDYVNKSISRWKADTTRRRRKRKLVFISLSALTICAVILALLAQRAQKSATVERTKALIAETTAKAEASKATTRESEAKRARDSLAQQVE